MERTSKICGSTVIGRTASGMFPDVVVQVGGVTSKMAEGVSSNMAEDVTSNVAGSVSSTVADGIFRHGG